MEKIRYYKSLPLESVKNARSLGGYPSLDGKISSWSSFYRSASLDNISNKDIEFLKDLNIETIVDLRRPDEIRRKHKSLGKIKENFSYYNFSLSRRSMRKEEIERIIEGKDSISKSYKSIVENTDTMRELFKILANTKKPILYHCQEGKDRTGIVTMILLGLIGVRNSDIIADYEISSAKLGYIEDYPKDDRNSIFRITDPYNMKEIIGYIIKEYGSFEKYLKYIDVSDNQIEKLKEKLVE